MNFAISQNTRYDAKKDCVVVYGLDSNSIQVFQSD